MAAAAKTTECFQPLMVESQNESLWMPLGINRPLVDSAALLPLLRYMLFLLQVLNLKN